MINLRKSNNYLDMLLNVNKIEIYINTNYFMKNTRSNNLFNSNSFIKHFQ